MPKMVKKLSRKQTILIDSREQLPLPFPGTVVVDGTRYSLTGKVVTRHEGDYALKGYEDCCIVERKYSARELLKNLFDPKDGKRQAKALTRLCSACELPVLVLEATPALLLRPSRGVKDPSGLPLGLVRMLHRFDNLHLVFAPTFGSARNRQLTGELVASLLIASAILLRT